MYTGLQQYTDPRAKAHRAKLRAWYGPDTRVLSSVFDDPILHITVFLPRRNVIQCARVMKIGTLADISVDADVPVGALKENELPALGEEDDNA